MTKSILFDLDGTLTDSGEGIINCAKLALDHYGIPIPSDSELRTFVGPPLAESFLKYGIAPEQIDEALRVFRSRYLTVGKFENYPYPGIREMLQQLQNDGYSLFVATSKPEETAVEVLTHFDLAKYFTKICGATFDQSRTSKSDVIAFLLQQTGSAQNAIMVGDTAFDVIGASAHGIPTIGVSWGYGNVDEMISAGAVATADSPEMLYAMLRE